MWHYHVIIAMLIAPLFNEKNNMLMIYYGTTRYVAKIITACMAVVNSTTTDETQQSDRLENIKFVYICYFSDASKVNMALKMQMIGLFLCVLTKIKSNHLSVTHCSRQLSLYLAPRHQDCKGNEESAPGTNSWYTCI